MERVLVVLLASLVFAVAVLLGGAVVLVTESNTHNQIVQSRKSDCQEAEALRVLGIRRAQERRAEVPKDLQLLHIAPSEQVLALAEKTLHQTEEELAPKNCQEVAERGL